MTQPKNVNKILDKARKKNATKKSSSSKRVDESYVVASKTFDINSQAVSESALKSHEKLFQGYVDSLNHVATKLDSVDKSISQANDSSYRSLKIDETYNANGTFLHGLYFGNIGSPESVISIDSLAYMRLARDFGTFDEWQQDFIAAAMASRNGWALTVYNIFLKRYMNCVVDLHSLNVPIGCIPVIVLDVWEHAYYRDYLNDRKAYVFKTMQDLNWDIIEERIKNCDKVSDIYGD